MVVTLILSLTWNVDNILLARINSDLEDQRYLECVLIYMAISSCVFMLSGLRFHPEEPEVLFAAQSGDLGLFSMKIRLLQHEIEASLDHCPSHCRVVQEAR
jgi:hypothetical protein